MPQLRSKTRVFEDADGMNLPDWSFDGGSTNQASVHMSDVTLRPVRVYKDPFVDEGYLVMCDTWVDGDTPHASNSRYPLEVQVINEKIEQHAPLFGFEQEYTMLNHKGLPLAWDEKNHEVQGDYYCGVGTSKIYRRSLVMKHLDYCLFAGVGIYGINAEVMPGQWEFQTSPQDPMKSSDDLWIARYILARLAEEENVIISYDPKPMTGEWNGAGCHTNFSTEWMRDSWDGILHAVDCLSRTHETHMKDYGKGNELRMTGGCETSDPSVFTMAESDRSCSVRIPIHVADAECGYIEDRRPAANIDPYVVCRHLLTSICNEY
jgi:glutamine synthetase